MSADPFAKDPRKIKKLLEAIEAIPPFDRPSGRQKEALDVAPAGTGMDSTRTLNR